MSSVRRVVPFALLAVLALGSALGIGLGLAEAPASHRTVPPVTTTAPSSPGRNRTSPVPPAGALPCTGQALQLSSSAVDANTPPKVTQGAITLFNASSASCLLGVTLALEVLGNTGTVLVSSRVGVVGNDLIRAGQAQGADIGWENWCGPDLRPLSLAVILPDGGGSLSVPFGDDHTPLPGCLDRSQPSQLFAHKSAGFASLFGR